LKRFVVGITGASGSLCARSVLREMARHPDVGEIHAVLSGYAIRTINAELGSRARDAAAGLKALLGAGGRRAPSAKIILHRADAMEASISSGSFPTDGMVVVPCSGGTLAAIANGTSANLLQRAGEVTLKERRPLILALRETPLSLVHIENMRRAALAGAILYPLMPAFYTGPRTLDDIVEQFTARIFDLMHLPHGLGSRWGTAR
jgi:4-hydroxy-3-polyprenylbenzoate decarboxylase